MDRAYFLYVQEITNFLNNVVIKFSPFVDIFNQNATYLAVDGYDENDPTTYPYYRILTGDTAFAINEIYGYLPSTQSEVLLTRETVALHPDIVSFYREPKNLKLLVERYPEDDFIIRRLINPVTDIQFAIKSKNLTILPTQFSDQFLNEYERNSLLIFLQDILWRIDYRWYMVPLEFEDLYPYAFWGMLWNVLPFLLLTKRILNLRTLDVHPFHIWEYLTSMGFDGYRGYLTRNQEMFLYRNARYLKFHAGKSFLLDILESVFLLPLKYNLSKRDIIAHTYDRESTYDKYPDVIPSSSGNLEYQSSLTIESLLSDIYDDGYDSNNDSSYLSGVIDKLIKSPVNHLSTKFLAFDRNIDMSELMLLIRFILDEVVFLYSTNKLSFSVNIQSPITQNILQFDNVLDALSLFYYCIYVNDNPTIPFDKYTLTTALVHDTKPDINKHITIGNNSYYVPTYVEYSEILNNTPYISEMLYFPKDLSTKLGDLYIWLFAMINTVRSVTDTVEHEAYCHILKNLVPEIKVISLDQPYESYNAFFARYPKAYEEISQITDYSEYADMMYAIMTGICPLEYGFAALARDDEVVSILINKIKELFMYLVSYNITFLNPNIERTINVDLPKLVMRINRGVSDESGFVTDFIGSFIYIGNNMLDTFNQFISINHISEKNITLDDVDFDCDMTQTITSRSIHIENDNSNFDWSVKQTGTTTIYEKFGGSKVTFLNHLG